MFLLNLAAGCHDAAGPSTGSALVTVTTAGPGADTTIHYVLSVDGGTGKAVAANSSLTFDGLAAGSHTLTLSGTPRNCSVGQNPRDVTIVPGGTATIPFVVTCVLATGSLQITATTAGADPGPGYALSVDYQPTQPLGANSAIVIANLALGSHTVALSGAAANCTIAAPNPVTVTIGNGDTTRITFSISCVAVGVLRLTAVTTGVDLDVDGYTIFVNGTQGGLVASNGATTVSPLASGTRSVLLSDISSNCAVTGSNPQSVVIPVHDTARMTFQLACVKEAKIAFTAVGDYTNGNNPQIWVTNGDGTNLVLLTHGWYNARPAWSPDGAKIAFHTNRDGNFEVYVMNADGTGLVNLTHNAAVDSSPAWSPDGTKIAFYSNRDGTDGLYVMNADGSGVAKLTAAPGGFDPAWSPDGTKIAFDCRIDVANTDVCVINADNTGLTRLTSDPAVDYEPAWKRDGSKILFVTGRFGTAPELALMNPDGTGVTPLYGNLGVPVNDPAWSPDAVKVAFHAVVSSCASSGCYNSDEIWVANADGSGNISYPAQAVLGSQPAWRP
jgi:Tol biopolymer transport system component